MEASLIQTYHVIEFGNGVAVVLARDVRPGGRPLIEADLPTCGEYLARYLHERAHGKGIVAAHAAALKGANVIRKGNIDRQGPMQ